MSLCKECLFLLYNSMVSFFFLGHSFVYPYLFTLHLIFFSASQIVFLIKIALTYIKYS